MSLRAHWLPALGAFEAAARHLNFARAGEELHLTASAVSHHVRRLEEMLGVVLFRRQARGVALTPEGQLLADATGGALGELNAAFTQLHASREEPRVRVSVLPSLARSWLLPRLGRFTQAHPKLRLVVDADRGAARFEDGGPDFALRYGRGPWPGLVARFLMDDVLFPAASPRLAGVKRVRTAEDVAALPLVDDVSPRWSEWFREAGVRGLRPEAAHTFSDSALALDAAAAGLGAVLARQRLAAAYLEDGRLVRLPGPSVSLGLAYYVVYPPHRVPGAAAQRFIAWLEREARAEGAVP
ncbi:LysR family transcriptional regulator [Aggregicoccus sp. 17bor-14]|uniref:LysR substrate-binding domain-containing protein n=1 Tax=Myxococcaceae TaxID=31 RepID=UPI00129C6707|nr:MULTISPECIES: LysR substrate-binding domain-containing protein [Myxococcaceae]MBF5044628.1 LysR family transcriptional regulator [Simulacricoccus sp. 17bor-14]MRI90372.1 LysR family transcriptional regulator [Aggregicoccus sp. 17bor-14]